MKQAAPLTILVLYWHPDPSQMRPAIRHHLRALELAPVSHHVVYANAYGRVPGWVRSTRFDAVVLHTTFLCLRWSHLFPFWKWSLRWVGALNCRKIALPQDEYDHSDVLDDWMHEWGVDTIFSNFDEPLRRLLYPISNTAVVFRKALTGYIDPATAEAWQRRVSTLACRPTDIVYRASRLPFWFGSHGQLKHQVADVVGARARDRGFAVDVSTREADTIVGDAWFDFLASGKAVLGCESGSSVVDRRGEVRARIQYLLREEPANTFEAISRRMPAGWDSHQFFAISPRHLEAVLTKTAQILVRGAYDGVLEADRHYVPLERDLANVDPVLDRLAEPEAMQALADRAYREIYEDGAVTYRDFAAQLDEVFQDTTRHRVPFATTLVRRGRLELERMPPDRTHPGLARWIAHDPARARTALRLVMRRPELRRLWLRNGGWRRAGFSSEGVGVLTELFILALLAEGNRGRSTAGEPFRVQIRHEPGTQRLRLVSAPPTAVVPPPEPVDVTEALKAGCVIEVDHSAVATALHHAITPRKWVSVPLGAGPFELAGLSRLARPAPAEVAGAIASVRLQEPATRAPGILARLRSDPVVYGAKGIVAVRALLQRRSLRSLWLAYLRTPDLRRAFSADLILEELLKLSVLADLPVRRSYRRRDHTLIMETFPTGATIPPDDEVGDGRIEGVIWDNSTAGSSIPARLGMGKRITVFVGEQGIYEFRALPDLFRARPREAAAALGLERFAAIP
jgi:hypothetical protein